MKIDNLDKMTEEELKLFFTCKKCGGFDPEDEGTAFLDDYFCEDCCSLKITPITEN